MISDSIRNQSKQIFQNIEYIFNNLNEQNINSQIGVFPFWKQMYHLLHSIDQHFINPTSFKEPPFHIKNLNFIYLESSKTLTKEQLYSYFNEIRKKIELYLLHLDDSMLNERIDFNNMTLTKTELILSQFRHIFYHIGYFHCCFKLLNGETPEYIGLYKSIPEK